MPLPKKKVHIVMRIGPEWGTVVDVFFDKKEANTLAGKKNDRAEKSKDVLERMSQYTVVTKTVKENGIKMSYNEVYGE